MNKNTCTNCEFENISKMKLRYCSNCGYELPKLEKITTEETTVELKKKINFKKIFISIVFFIIAYISGHWAVSKFITNNLSSFDKVMMKTASLINESCPVMVDNETRLDNTVAMPNNVFQYNYTLIKMEKSTLNIESLEEYLLPILTNGVKTNPKMKIHRENNTTFEYQYKDKNGTFLFNIPITPEMYK